jgi:hypothetical protein
MGARTTHEADVLQEDDLKLTTSVPFSSNESTWWGASCCHQICHSLTWWRGLRASDLDALERRQKVRR